MRVAIVEIKILDVSLMQAPYPFPYVHASCYTRYVHVYMVRYTYKYVYIHILISKSGVSSDGRYERRSRICICEGRNDVASPVDLVSGRRDASNANSRWQKVQ